MKRMPPPDARTQERINRVLAKNDGQVQGKTRPGARSLAEVRKRNLEPSVEQRIAAVKAKAKTTGRPIEAKKPCDTENKPRTWKPVPNTSTSIGVDQHERTRYDSSGKAIKYTVCSHQRNPMPKYTPVSGRRA